MAEDDSRVLGLKLHRSPFVLHLEQRMDKRPRSEDQSVEKQNEKQGDQKSNWGKIMQSLISHFTEFHRS